MNNNNKEAKPKGLMTNLKRLLGYLTRYKVHFTLMIAIMLGYSIMLAIIPTISGVLMNILSGSSGSLTELQNTILVLVGVVILFWVFGNVSQRILARIAQKALYNLRTELFSNIQKSSLTFFDKRPIGELMSNVTNDLDVVDQFLSVSFMNVLQGMITIIIATIFMILINPYFTILTFITIQEGLLKLQEGKTSFIIAHRLSTIQNSDQILVINDGEIIERGSHQELLDMKGFYYDLYMSQFRGKIDDICASK